MKKGLFITLLLIVLFPFITAKADVGSLCDYEGILFNAPGKQINGTAKLTLEGDNYVLRIDTIYNLELADALTYIYDFFSGGTLPTHTYEFTFNSNLKNATRTDVDVWYAPGEFGNNTWDVDWNSTSEKTDLRDKAFCPSSITIKSKSSLGATGDFDFKFVVGAPESPSADDYNPSDSNWTNATNATSAENYYLKAAVFSQSLIDTLTTYATTCISDTDTIYGIASFYDFTHPNLDNATNDEKAELMEIYTYNGMADLAQQFIDTYSPGTDCYNNNPDAQEAYDYLVGACEEFLYNLTGEEANKVDSCEEIIGSGTFAYYLNQVFRFIQYVGPILVIIYSTIEYIRVVAKSDADALKKTNQRTIIRLIFALLLFLIPIILKVILNIVGFYGDCLNTVL